MFVVMIFNSEREKTFEVTGSAEAICGILVRGLLEVGSTIMLIDGETGEILQETTVIELYDMENLIIVDDDEDDYPEEPDDLECGFNPYMGGYDYDC